MFRIEPTIQGTIDEAEIAEAEQNRMNEGGMLTPEQAERLEEVKKKFKVFVDGECLETTPLISHKIEFEESFKDADPVRLNPYPWSPEVQRNVNEELDKWLASGVVERSNSDWALLIVPVMKRTEGEDGQQKIKVRMCLDARKLNDRTRKDAYPLPHQDRILGRLGSSK